ncbi:MAG TPA: response regulator, partial [Pyrinomonadaceae bacterium]|nr:response regulator [Pyrinomonadaceae bacterium]
MTRKANVLLVDDEPDKRQLLAYALQVDGYEVRTAVNGVEALSAVETEPPDLIITDVMMPQMDGYEMARRVRANPRTRFVPIILQSAAKKAAQDVRRGVEAGALGYLVDPTDIG